jgi:DNA primase
VPETPQEIAAEISDSEVVLSFAERRWRVRGLARNLAYDVLKVNLLASVSRDGVLGTPGGEAFHVDTLDLYNARARMSFVTQAAIELQLAEEVVTADLGRVLLKLEALQDEAIRKALEPKPAEAHTMDEAEREASLALLRSPDLMARILADFAACGVVGEETNKLVGYLAAVSRKLASPLAVLIQSSSAAGKSALMEAVLAFVPPEERVQYSAMTGQSLFYMGETNLKHRILAIAEEEGAARAAMR